MKGGVLLWGRGVEGEERGILGWLGLHERMVIYIGVMGARTYYKFINGDTLPMIQKLYPYIPYKNIHKIPTTDHKSYQGIHKPYKNPIP